MSIKTTKADLASFKGKKVLVVGDYIVDHYRFLSPKALSPEAPIVCFKAEHEELRHGGAGNVAMNIMALGGQPTLLSSFSLSDAPAIPFPVVAIENGPARRTTVKERLLTTRQQVARIDKQSNVPISPAAAGEMVQAARKLLDQADVVVFSDYDHGVMVRELVRPILDMAMAMHKPSVVDSKALDTVSKYKFCTLAVPNENEAKAICSSRSGAAILAEEMSVLLGGSSVAVTCGPEGVFLYLGHGPFADKYYPAHVGTGRVVDVTGAGDTFTATCAMGLSAAMQMDSIIHLANLASGIKIGKLGVASVSPEEIIAEVVRE